MEYLSLILNFIKENNLFRIIIILLVLFTFIFILNIIINYIKNKTKNNKTKKIITFLKTPVLVTITIIGMLFYIKQSGVLGLSFDIFSKFIKTILFIYYLSIANNVNKLFTFPAINKVLVYKKAPKDILVLVDKVLGISVFIIGIYIIFTVWDINLTPLLASAGIAGMALALAAKDSLANLFGGVSMFLDSAFKVGDYVIIDGDKRGEVIETGFRSTKIKTRDDVLVTIPNSVLANATLINESAPRKNYRIKIPVGVSYGSDLDFVESILLNSVEGIDGILNEPEKRVRVRGFGNSSIDIELLIWISDPSLRGSVKHNLFKKIYNLFNENNITIPFPQMDVNLNK